MAGAALLLDQLWVEYAYITDLALRTTSVRSIAYPWA